MSLVAKGTFSIEMKPQGGAAAAEGVSLAACRWTSASRATWPAAARARC